MLERTVWCVSLAPPVNLKPPRGDPGSSTCTSTGRGLSLPVLASPARNAWQGGKHPTIKHSRVGKWRAWALILVHVLIAAHIVQWLVTGLTVSPVEPSESMQTLRDGVVNAGFVFFVLALGSTLVFGRFFCGWACHVVALQDLCAWLMMRAGIKPKPFRSRLLLYIPLCLALYMFAWPVVHREVVRPLFADAAGRLPAWLGQVEPLLGLRSEFLVEEFWATFAPWYMAIPFLFVVGFATVYFLGAKAFCTYGCPYGGFFAPLDRFAPGRILVDDTKCNQCGHCTAVCTSNVRVHEEVRDFGKVMDPGCMKCLDCVSVCPNDALRFGMSAPAVWSKPKPSEKESAAKAKALREARYDLSRREEVVFFVLFWCLFYAFRGMVNEVPMLMAVAMAGVGVYFVFKTWRLTRDASSRMHGLQLKLKGRITLVGWAWVIATVLMLATASWSGWVRVTKYRAALAYAELSAPLSQLLRPDFAPSPRELRAARDGLGRYARSDSFRHGGYGWWLRPDELVEIAYMRLLTGDQAGAEAALSQVVEKGTPRDGLIFELETLMRRRGSSDADIEKMMQAALAKHPDLHGVRDRLARAAMSRQEEKAARASMEEMLTKYPRSVGARLTAAGFFKDLGEVARASGLLEEAVKLSTRPDQLVIAGRMFDAIRQRERARAVADLALSKVKRDASARISVAELLMQLDLSERADQEVARAVDDVRRLGKSTSAAGALSLASVFELRQARPERALDLAKDAADRSVGDAYGLATMGNGLMQAGMSLRRPSIIAAGVEILERARKTNPSASTIRHDLAAAYYAANRLVEASQEIVAAAELAPQSRLLAERAASLFEALGDQAKAAKWRDEAQKRK